jgi:hypothetical protein
MKLKVGTGEGLNGALAMQRLDCGIGDYNCVSGLLAERRTRMLSKIVEQTPGD